jgi:hypothetical protein
MILSWGEFSEATTRHAIETLSEALRVTEQWNLTVREINTDRGCQFYPNSRLGADPGLGQFQEFLASRSIRHVVSRVNSPQTNGKAERLWLEYDKLRWRFPTLEAWIAWKIDEVHGRSGTSRRLRKRSSASSPWKAGWGSTYAAWRRRHEPASEEGQESSPFPRTPNPKGN